MIINNFFNISSLKSGQHQFSPNNINASKFHDQQLLLSVIKFSK